MINFNKYGIDVTKLRGGKSLCPKCSHARHHKGDLCLSVDVESGLFNCHNCEFKGCAVEFNPKKEFVKPVPRLEKISKPLIGFFEGRGISNNTILQFKITEANGRMCFNYFRDEELVNIKYRSIDKQFTLSKDAELIFYNLDAIKDESAAIVVEGEIDCLTLHECGIYNVVSVPNGASKGNQKLEYLDTCWNYFENKEKIILAIDNDEAGDALRDELARRLGKEKCFTVQYPPNCKDANETLLNAGKQALVSLIENATQWPLEGIMTMVFTNFLLLWAFQ
jgi:twinkle protein